MPFDITAHMSRRERVNCPRLAKIHADKARADAAVKARKAYDKALLLIDLIQIDRRNVNKRLDEAYDAASKAEIAYNAALAEMGESND